MALSGLKPEFDSFHPSGKDRNRGVNGIYLGFDQIYLIDLLYRLQGTVRTYRTECVALAKIRKIEKNAIITMA